MKDITGANMVEVVIRNDSKVLWVNVDGECELRICQIKEFFLVDDREGIQGAINGVIADLESIIGPKVQRDKARQLIKLLNKFLFDYQDLKLIEAELQRRTHEQNPKRE